MMSPASGISMPIVKVMPCTADTSGLRNRRPNPNGSTGAGPSRCGVSASGPKNSGMSSPAVA